jgi:hypothetical protein
MYFRGITYKRHRKFYVELRRFDKKFLMATILSELLSDSLDLNKLFRKKSI